MDRKLADPLEYISSQIPAIVLGSRHAAHRVLLVCEAKGIAYPAELRELLGQIAREELGIVPSPQSARGRPKDPLTPLRELAAIGAMRAAAAHGLRDNRLLQMAELALKKFSAWLGVGLDYAADSLPRVARRAEKKTWTDDQWHVLELYQQSMQDIISDELKRPYF